MNKFLPPQEWIHLTLSGHLFLTSAILFCHNFASYAKNSLSVYITQVEELCWQRAATEKRGSRSGIYPNDSGASGLEESLRQFRHAKSGKQKRP